MTAQSNVFDYVPPSGMAGLMRRARAGFLARLGEARLAVASFQNRRHRHQVSAILASDIRREVLDDETLFEQLQAAYTRRVEYGYDSATCLKRGAERAKTLLRIPQLAKRGVRTLESSCGDGMTGWCLAQFGHDVQLHDLEDWRDPRARNLPLCLGDLSYELSLPAEGFDLVCSYNAFEHVTDPTASLQELLRLCRVGGLVFLDFGPLFASPWGLHAYRSLRMPYPQFLFSEKFIEEKLRQLGIRDLGKERTTLQPMNRWRLGQFEALWRQSGCRILKCRRYHTKPSHTDLVVRFPSAFAGRGLTHEDVTVESLSVLLQKMKRI